MVNVLAKVAEANAPKNDKDSKGFGPDSGRLAYDPRGNSHCFNKGFEPSWWDANNCASLDEFTPHMAPLMKGAGAYFDVVKGLCGTVLPDGTFVESNPKSYNLLRKDRLDVTLQVGVGAQYATDPHYEVCIVPEEVTITASDFADQKGVLEFLQAQHPDVEINEIELPVTQLMTPAGCNCWSDGRVVTTQYLLGEFEPRGGDKHRVFLTVVSPIDGSKTGRFYLTVVRIVCENTMAHAEEDGWAKLTGLQQLRQRAPRRTASYTKRLADWHGGFSNVMAGSVQILETFKKMAGTKIAATQNRRDEIIRQFVCDQLGLDLNAKTKTGATRAANTLDSVLTKAIYNDDLGGGKNCETLFDLWCGWTAQTQHFAQVNGLDKNPKLEEEKRYMNTLLLDKTMDANAQAFQSVLALAS